MSYSCRCRVIRGSQRFQNPITSSNGSEPSMEQRGRYLYTRHVSPLSGSCCTEPSLTSLFLQVYEGLRYRLSLDFPAGYPYQAPRVKFVTSCFHPNVDEQGFICLDILKDKWSALYDVRSILLSIQSLLGGMRLCSEAVLIVPQHVAHSPHLPPEPNNDSPLNTAAAEMWENQEGKNTRTRWLPSSCRG